MEFELLGNICEVVRGSSPRPQGDKRYYGGRIPRLMIADVTRDKKYVTPIIDSLTEEGAAKSRPMKKGDLIIAVSGDPGRVCFLNIDACIHDGFVGLRNLDELKYDKEYLYYYLTFFKASMKHRAYGAIFQNITTDILKAIKIPKLSITKQLHIANLLSKAENLIAQRKESVRLLDEFLKSTFLEMFGDPVRNEKGFEPITLGDLFKVSSGDGLTSDNMNPSGKHNVYGGNGVNGKYDKYMFDEPKIVIGRVGFYCGAVHLTEPKSWVTDNALYIKELYKASNIQYLKHFLTLLNLNRFAGQAAQPLISGNRLYPIKTFYAPIDIQNQFAEIVQKTEALKTQYQQSLIELENLYGSLSQRAFKGELKIKRNETIEHQ